MYLRFIIPLITLTALGFASTASAHHPPRMERCEAHTFDGQIEDIVWRNPHVQLVVKDDKGTSYRLTWLNTHQLSWDDIDRNTLQVGNQVTVTTGTRDDLVDMPQLLVAITRAADGWAWSQVPQGC